MIETNIWIVEFVSGNIILIGLISSVLKVIAMQTESVLDDKIVGLLTGWVSNIRGSSKGGGVAHDPVEWDGAIEQLAEKRHVDPELKKWLDKKFKNEDIDHKGNTEEL